MHASCMVIDPYMSALKTFYPFYATCAVICMYEPITTRVLAPRPMHKEFSLLYNPVIIHVRYLNKVRATLGWVACDLFMGYMVFA